MDTTTFLCLNTDIDFVSFVQAKSCLDHRAMPMDGMTLTEALHQHGINIRYLGTLLEYIEKIPQKERLDHVYVSVYLLLNHKGVAKNKIQIRPSNETRQKVKKLFFNLLQKIALCELITRCAKHLFKTYLLVRMFACVAYIDMICRIWIS